MRLFKSLILTSLLLCFVAGVGLLWTAGSMLIRGEASVVPPAASPARDFTLTSTSGVRLASTYWHGKRPDAPAVLLLHGVGASRAATAANAAWLARLGYATLTIDFRGHGQSTTTARSFGLHEAEDARTAFEWIKARQQGAPVAVIGISMGGAASLLGRAGPLPADAFVLQAVYPDIRHAIRNRIASRLGRVPAWLVEPWLSLQSLPRFGVWPSELSPEVALRQVRAPVMVIGGAEDRFTPPIETRRMAAAASGVRGLWLVPGHDHAATCSDENDSYRRHVAAFLAGTIGQP